MKANISETVGCFKTLKNVYSQINVYLKILRNKKKLATVKILVIAYHLGRKFSLAGARALLCVSDDSKYLFLQLRTPGDGGRS